MRSTQVPNMTVTSSGVSVKCAGQIDMYADTKGKQKPFLVTLYAVSLFCLLGPLPENNCPQGYKTFFMINPNQLEFFTNKN